MRDKLLPIVLAQLAISCWLTQAQVIFNDESDFTTIAPIIFENPNALQNLTQPKLVKSNTNENPAAAPETRQLVVDFLKPRVDELFQEEVSKILDEGPRNRMFMYLLEFFPQHQHRKALREGKIIPNFRRIFPRQAAGAAAAAAVGTLFNQSSAATNDNFVQRTNAHMTIQISPASPVIDAKSTMGIRVAQNIAQRLTSANAGVDSNDVLSNLQAPNQFCPFQVTRRCNPNEKFSSLDGSCNNLQQPWLGKSETVIILKFEIFCPLKTRNIKKYQKISRNQIL
jgi:hypothetical protein